MIDYRDGVFRFTTENTSYWFRVTRFGHLEQVYYGARIIAQDADAVALKRTVQVGSSVAYDQSDTAYSLDIVPLEWSGNGAGDFRFSPCEIVMPSGGYSTDFVYSSHTVENGDAPPEGLPSAYGGSQTLCVVLRDSAEPVELKLFYTVFEQCDVIVRRVCLTNKSEKPISIRRLLSCCIDIPNKGFELVTLDGGWIKETNRHSRPVEQGIYINSSTTGASSNRHNPAFALCTRGANETTGGVYGFNLIYSGNHMGAVELSTTSLVRAAVGINSHCFDWTLKSGESFDTPQAVLCYSESGFGGLSRSLHGFVNEHIVRGEWKGRERPVLLNNWEAHFFKFTGRKLTRLARQAKELGVELFVLDDGWFGKRNTDTAGLGDYNVNLKKLPGGLQRLSKRINRMGLSFGLWFEPEMTNPDSDLYRAHPEYVARVPNRKMCMGRNQLVLDLCNPAVRDYIVKSMGGVLDSANIEYVKWDMNRHISDAFSPTLCNQGEFYHRYILGLYDILTRVFSARPRILLESCSSGGNRFDLGMLCFSPQVWASDNTDPIERLRIQGGLSLFYPQSTFGAHVSMSPHMQTLRETPLSTRFNVAAFGCLGYELDLKHLNRMEKKEIRGQIEFYKKHRKTLQYGEFSRCDCDKDNKVIWQSGDSDETVAGVFQTVVTAAEGYDRLPVRGLSKNALYRVAAKPQTIPVKRFGGLVRFLLPFELDPNGFILRTANKLYAMPDGTQDCTVGGDVLEDGLRLNEQFLGSGYNDKLRMLGDFGSTLYTINKLR